MEILVFKTNVTSKRKVSKVQPLLTSVAAITQWNFDLEDCDNILRVEGENVCPESIAELVAENGYECDVLE